MWVKYGNLFGLPFDYAAAKTIIFGVPWEVTVSYRPGTALAPQQILDASPQLDLYDFDHPDGWRKGIYMPPIDRDLLEKTIIIDRKQLQLSIDAE